MKTIEAKKACVLLGPTDGPNNPETHDRLLVCDLVGGLGCVGAVLDIHRNVKGDRANDLLSMVASVVAFNDFVRALPKMKGGSL